MFQQSFNCDASGGVTLDMNDYDRLACSILEGVQEVDAMPLYIRTDRPVQGKPVLVVLKDGSVHEGHWLKNANFKEQNVNRWAIYSPHFKKTIADEEVRGWIPMPSFLEEQNNDK